MANTLSPGAAVCEDRQRPAEIGNGTMYIGAINNGSFVVTHANNAQADRTFLYVALG
jgi:hypothetical protein